MKDLGGFVATERNRKGWVSQLQTKTVRRRQALGQTPKL